METLVIETGQTGYAGVLNHVRSYGADRSPRGKKTLDLGHTTIVIEDPRRSLPIHTGRKLNPAIGAVEALQLVAGEMNDDLLVKIAPQFERFREPDGKFHGAYGRRLIYNHQLANVVKRLKADPDTRQAIATIWSPQHDNTPGKLDYPCTIALGFGIRNDQLEMYTTMRSNDAWLGAPYDWFQFTQLQLTIAGLLGVEPGPYHHTAWSLHLYEEHWDLIDSISPSEDGFLPQGIGNGDEDSWYEMKSTADYILNGIWSNPTPSEEWYVQQLAPHLG